YVALAYGHTQSSGVIEAPIARRSDSIIKREVNDKGKYAKTVYQRLMQNETASLCKVKLLTGRTHQIRVHFEYIGHPLIGDDLYGG
ncbi:RNA pseudouridine synthase, partial [Staphylococcus lugdunensis]